MDFKNDAKCLYSKILNQFARKISVLCIFKCLPRTHRIREWTEPVPEMELQWRSFSSAPSQTEKCRLFIELHKYWVCKATLCKNNKASCCMKFTKLDWTRLKNPTK